MKLKFDFAWHRDHSVIGGRGRNSDSDLTVLVHEVGHVLGFEHTDDQAHPVVSASVDPGRRNIEIFSRATVDGGHPPSGVQATIQTTSAARSWELQTSAPLALVVSKPLGVVGSYTAASLIEIVAGRHLEITPAQVVTAVLAPSPSSTPNPLPVGWLVLLLGLAMMALGRGRRYRYAGSHRGYAGSSEAITTRAPGGGPGVDFLFLRRR